MSYQPNIKGSCADPMGLHYTLTFRYKGNLYSFSDLTDRPMDIEVLLKAIDEGKVPSLPEFERIKS